MSHLITKFEYDYLSKEELTDEEIEELLKINSEGKFNFQEEETRIKLSQYVGLILLSTGKSIEILPKIYRNRESEDISKARKLLTILFYELFELAERPLSGSSLHSKKVEFNIPFFEIILLIILDYIEKKIIQPGIYKNYMRNKLTSKSLNGKLLLSQTLLKFPFQKDKFKIEKEVLTSNILINQILAKFVEFVSNKFYSSKIKNLAGRIFLYLRSIGVESSQNIVEDLKKLSLNRMNSHYYPVIQIAKFLFSQNRLTSFQGHSFVFLYDMNKLFEIFVASSLSKCLSQVEERIDVDFSLKPDILCPLEREKKYIVLDTKWKFPTDASTRETGISRNDRFQVITYMYTLEERKNIRIPLGILLYPELPFNKKIWNISNRRKLLALGLELKRMLNDRSFSKKGNLDEYTNLLKRKIKEKVEAEVKRLLLPQG